MSCLYQNAMNDNEKKWLEYTFHISNDVKPEVYIEVPENPEGLVQSNLVINLDAAYIFLFTNRILKIVYEAHSVFKKQRIAAEEYKIFSSVNIINQNSADYLIGIQTVISCLYKALCVILQIIETDYISEKKLKNYNPIVTIENLYKRKSENSDSVEEIYKRLVKSQMNDELIRMIAWLNNIYNSPNMMSGHTYIGKDYPTVIVMDGSPNQEFNYIKHNHSLPQIIAGFNAYLKEIDFFLKDWKR